MRQVVETEEKGGVRLSVQSTPPALVDKEGILVVRAEPVGDLTDVTRRERDRQTLDPQQRAGL